MTSTGTKHGPRVSIGLPVYNGERYIEETLESLLTQTYEDFELIICDNDSHDRTEEICRAFAAKDPRIYYVRNSTNLGAAKNYRLTFELSSGEYFRWANCDDLFALTSLERCVEVLDRELSTILVYPRVKLIGERGQIISDYDDGLHLQADKASTRFIQLSRRLGLVNAIYGLIRANILKKTGLIGNFVHADMALMADLTLYGKFWEIPEVLFYRRIHPGAYAKLRSVEEQQEFFDPESRGRIPLTHWRHFCANCRAACRAPISVAEKCRVMGFLTRQGIRDRNELGGEMVAVARHALHSIFFNT
jgi:glycosyltransferase involved in cell wall biosynthesis